MDLLRGAVGDPALEVSLAHALLRQVSAGAAGPVLRVYRPQEPTCAFGRRDVRLPGFGWAVDRARAAGFAPVVRAPGGRVVAYTTRALVVDHVSPDPEWPSGLDGRFTEYGQLWADVLRGFGVDARVGEVPGEYCPGSASVNARGVVKLVGTAQRMVRGAWLFSAVLVHDDADVLRPVLEGVYRDLDLPFATSTVGSVREEAPDASLDVLEEAVLAAYDQRFGLSPAPLSPDLLARARDLVVDHQP
ncbi:MAG TPA: lipoate--protein ligase family protein [Nocardioidaceae bacterium]|nr:lipoate--protein ligase family protein [Nocardioidaceae bacterium]